MKEIRLRSSIIYCTHHTANLNLSIHLISSLFLNLHTNTKSSTAPHPISITPTYCWLSVYFIAFSRKITSIQPSTFLPADCHASPSKVSNSSLHYVGAKRGNKKLVSTLSQTVLRVRENKQQEGASAGKFLSSLSYFSLEYAQKKTALFSKAPIYLSATQRTWRTCKKDNPD